MSLLIKKWALADWKERLKLARIGANNAMIGEFTEVEEVPPHGRLGDLDALKERATKRLYASNHGSMAEAYYAAIIDLIDSAPTIIPTEPFNNLSKPCKDDADFPICTKASPASLGIYKKAEEGET